MDQRSTGFICHATKQHRSGYWQRLRVAFALRRHRQALARLDDAALRDIGLSRAEAERESQRRFWDVPDHWRR